MDLGLVEKIMQLMQSYGLREIEIKEGDSQIRLTQAPEPSASAYPPMALAPGFAPPMAPPMPAAMQRPTPTVTPSAPDERRERRANQVEVRSPFVGTYYGAPSPGADSFVHVGKRVRKGDTLCIVEAMKLMNEIEAERDGVIVEILAENEEPVEYDQVLFVLE